jgi:hypothetical protein
MTDINSIRNDITDPTLHIKKHTFEIYTYFCIIIRICIGLFLILYNINSSKYKKSIIIILSILFIFLLIVFLNKRNNLNNKNIMVWKCYIRTIYSLAINVILINTGNYKEAGILFITDTLIGLQSRHTATLI